MSERHPVYRLTQEAYDQLRLSADENPDSYLDSDIDFLLSSCVHGVYLIISKRYRSPPTGRSSSHRLQRGAFPTALISRHWISTGRSTG